MSLKVEKKWFYEDLSLWGKELYYAGSKEIIDSLIDEVCNICSLTLTKKKRKVLKVLLLNLYFINHISSGVSGLRILLGHKNTSSQSRQYMIYSAAHSLLSKIVHALKQNDLIDHKEGNVGHSTKIRLTKRGEGLLAERVNVEKIYVKQTPIFYKDTEKQLLTPPDYLYGKSKSKLVDEYNTLIVGSSVTVGEQLLYAPEKMVFRLFNDRQCSEDGRLYGALHQRIPKDLRRALKINGERTVEVDIVSTHPLLAYAEEGIDLTHQKEIMGAVNDIYQSRILFVQGRDERRIIKSLVVAMFNADKKESATDREFAVTVSKVFYKALNEDKANSSNPLKRSGALHTEKVLGSYQEDYIYSSSAIGMFSESGLSPDDEEYKSEYKKCVELSEGMDNSKLMIVDIVLDLLKKHEPIYEWFGSNAWKHLNFIESSILLRVVDHFTKKSIPILTIHDSVRVAESHKEELVLVYRTAIEKELGFNFYNKDKLLSIDGEDCCLSHQEQSLSLMMARRTDNIG
ncbi:MAG: hypothetical protein ACI9N9_001100 [Enterobacterales bacterium]